MNNEQEFLPIKSIDHVEFYVGNAKQAAYYYMTAFGFQPLAVSSLETGNRDNMSVVLRQNNITLVLTSSFLPDSPVSQHVRLHGDGIKVLALEVEDAARSFEETTKRGAQAYFTPREETDHNGTVHLSAIKTYGDTVHVFVDRSQYKGLFLPGFEKWEPDYRPTETGLRIVDHVVGNVDWGQMKTWAKFYEEVMGFKQLISFDDKDISTEYTALMSKVMTNGNFRVKFPINEPAHGKKKSQIEEFLDYYRGPGVQHLALHTHDILHTVPELRRRGVEFLTIPDAYYSHLLDRVGQIDEDIEELRQHNILVDRDEDGYLLQIFTRPLQDRPTFFVEIIQRKGARSFGKGNFKALFESIELEQERRGNL